ncbi:Glutathione S-transferase 1 [Blattella germanica]|nr:Glutathione S-transferase 1 [Blattella germanica]
MCYKIIRNNFNINVTIFFSASFKLYFSSFSRAILGYLVNQYGSDDSYYPKEPKKKALVDQRLYFDAGTLHQRLFEYFVLGVDISAYPNVSSWYERMKTELPGYDEINQAGANAFGQIFQSKLS